MTIKLHDLIAANNLLVSMGGEDQMSAIAAKSIESSLELRNRIERALAYAESAPNASVHARNMARILDGSITVDDELNEVDESRLPQPKRMNALPVPATEPRDVPAPKGKLKPGNGLVGRSTKERLAIREWIAQQGWEVAPSGRIPQKYLDLYDETQRHLKDQAKAERKAQAEANRAARAQRAMDQPMAGQLI